MNSLTDAKERKPFQVMYWRPKQVSKTWLWCSMLIAITMLALVQYCTFDTTPAGREPMLDAARRADASMRMIAKHRAQQGHRILEKLDPQGSHLIGPSMSMVTSKLGSLESKQTSVNPNFAAVVVRWMHDAGVKPGDRVAIGASGSWPALNIAVYAAVEAMQLRPTVILSASSSQYGANSSSMMWVDMQRVLQEAELTTITAAAASMGGLHDRAAGMTDQTRQLLTSAIARNAVPLLSENTLTRSVDNRMDVYHAAREGEAFAAYINVGGSSASIGGTVGQQLFASGLSVVGIEGMPDCVATRMLRDGVPVIHVGDAKHVATQYGLPIAPAALPKVGEGKVYGRPVYRVGLVLFAMLILCIAMALTIAPAWPLNLGRILGRWFGPSIPSNDLPSHPFEWMV